MHDWLGMHNLYLATAVLALADIIEGFRHTFQGICGIDLLHNLTLPKASWVGMLKSTKVHIELVTDQELYDDIEAGIRGGVGAPYQNHAVANDPRVQETTEPHSFIGYWDANSLYPWAMMYPCDDMDAFLQARLRDYDEDAPVSWYSVVDMMAPDHLHDTLDLAPTCKGEIDGVVKLLPYLGEQTEYISHLSLLVAYHRQGVVFTKVHRVWQYEQTRWLKPILGTSLPAVPRPRASP